MDDALSAVKAHLIEALTHEGFAREAIAVRDEPGPFDTRRLWAQADGAYPGTGVRVALVASDGVAYGACFTHGLVAFSHARHWFDEPPHAGDLVTAIDLLALDGMLQLDDDSSPSAARTDDGLEVRFTRLAFPSGEREPMLARIPRQGGLDLRLHHHAVTPIDLATRLVRALDACDEDAILDAIATMHAPLPTNAREALERAARDASPVVSAAARDKLDEVLP